MSEFRAIVVTVVAGSAGVLTGIVTAFGLNAGFALSAVPLAAPTPADLSVVLGVAGLIFAPAAALHHADFGLAKVTAALAGVWMILLVASVGPLLQAVGFPLFPFALAPAALLIARAIAGPFTAYIVARPTAVTTASR